MNTDPSYILQYLRSIIIHSLDTFNYANAEFAAERLVAHVPGDPEAIYLYSLVLYRQRKFKAAFNRSAEALVSNEHLGCAYIYARLCLELEKYKEGIFRLVSLTHLYNGTNTLASTDFSSAASSSTARSLASVFGLLTLRHSYEHNRLINPEQSAIYHLLGELYKAQGDLKSSILNYQKALRLNPFDFDAFQQMVSAGAEVSIRAIYKCGSSQSSSSSEQPNPSMGTSAQNHVATTQALNVSNPFSVTQGLFLPPELTTPRVLSTGVPDAPLRRTHGNSGAQPNEPGVFNPSSARLNGAKTPTTGARSLSHVRKKSEGVEALRSLKRNNSASLISPLATTEIESADMYLRRLYSVFAKLGKSFYKYDCYKAIRILESLPENERDSPWVLSKLGRLHYEIVNYAQSNRYFARLRQLDRTRLEDMEYYSTLLWHLHKKTELTYLANELHDIDSTLAITWCVMGNLFSLARETDEAIKCFNRAISINPKFTYAHTLKGHEYFGNDNYEQALECFRHSLLYDPRHYNALYGIGMVYINLGEYQKADYHFRKAVAINPINIILICCVGMILEKLGKKTAALRQYELANKLQPLNALPIFKKAQLLFAMHQYPQALKEFETVKELAPNEASVHFLLGQLYQIQNDKFLAIREFTIALNLDPKGNYLIREAMGSLNDETL